jgi:hypothetical protein
MTLELAHLCGWAPAGTQPSNGTDVGHRLSWQMKYLTSDGQVISATDAARMADAIERAAVEGQETAERYRAGQISLPSQLYTPADGFGWFASAAGLDHLRKLASFLRQGAVQIC